MNVKQHNLHPLLNIFCNDGGLFDVEPCELDLNVGRFGRVANPNQQGYGRIHKERFEIVGVQKNYRGEAVYRVVFATDSSRLGCVLTKEEVVLE